MKCDLYKQPFRLLLPDEKDSYRTFSGAFLTILSIIGVTVYAAMKLTIMFSRADYKVQIRDFDNVFTSEERFTADQGFALAAGLIQISSNTDSDNFLEIPDDIGALRFYRKFITEETGGQVKFQEIETRPCQKSDFSWEGNENADATFFSTDRTDFDLKKYWRNFRCAKNPDDLYNAGNYNTAHSETIMVVFEKCTYGSDLCATDEVIDEWLEFKYILTLENQKRFIQDKFTHERITSTAEISWYAINTLSRTDFVRIVTRTQMEILDDVWGFNAINELGFFVETFPVRTLPYKNKFQNSITYEMSLDQKYYYRTVYSSLDFLAEIGGLFSAFSKICLIVITTLNYFGSFQFVMADNFYYRSGHDEDGKAYKNDVQWNSLKSLQLNITTFAPKWFLCFCCKPNAANLRRSKSYEHILQETSVSYIIQELRVLKAAAKETRTPAEYENLRMKHALMAYEDLDSEIELKEVEVEGIITYNAADGGSRLFDRSQNGTIIEYPGILKQSIEAHTVQVMTQFEKKKRVKRSLKPLQSKRSPSSQESQSDKVYSYSHSYNQATNGRKKSADAGTKKVGIERYKDILA